MWNSTCVPTSRNVKGKKSCQCTHGDGPDVLMLYPLPLTYAGCWGSQNARPEWHSQIQD